MSCAEQIVATHTRVWTTGATITDPDHRKTAGMLRADLAAQRDHIRRTTRTHTDGHVVAIRALPDYDALFGVDFDPYPAATDDPGGPTAETTEGTIG